MKAIVASLGFALIAAAVAWWRERREKLEGRLAMQAIVDALGAYASGEASVRPAAAAWKSPDVRRAVTSVRKQGELLAGERAIAGESAMHLRTLLRTLDAAVFTVDCAGVITYVNRRASLLARSGISLVGQQHRDTVLGALVDGLPTLTDAVSYLRELRSTPAVSLWQVYASPIGSAGMRATLIAATDISAATRTRENRAFALLTRVLSHEINNSLAPIASITESVARRIERGDDDLSFDSVELLRAVSARAENLAEFVGRFGRAMNVPAARRGQQSLADVLRTVTLTRGDDSVVVRGGPSSTVCIDLGQLEQAIINLLANASFASSENGSTGVQVSWSHETSASGIPDHVAIDIDDTGRGISNTDNLFVPFFSTRKGGHGIGLFLSRRLIENNGGTLELGNHAGGGARARIRLPLEFDDSFSSINSVPLTTADKPDALFVRESNAAQRPQETENRPTETVR